MGNTWLKSFFIICDYNIIFYRIYSDNFRGKNRTYFQIFSSPSSKAIMFKTRFRHQFLKMKTPEAKAKYNKQRNIYVSFNQKS